jgi:pimeloyl-ACP methyl ester carboxylesterase
MRLKRPIKFSLIASIGVLAAAAIVALRPGFTFPILRSGSVASLEEVVLNGAPQWILIRGRPDKPIVLFLHGGPGMPVMYLAHAFQRLLESDFLVVQWDRRGAGKTYSKTRNPGFLRTSQEVADTAELVHLLTQRYGQRRVIVVGHSYGSYLGVAFLEQHPELVRAYVGVGQVSCVPDVEAAIQDAWLRQQAAAAGDRDTLAHIGAAHWDRESALFRYGAVVAKWTSVTPMILTGLASSEYSFSDAMNVQKGVTFTHRNFVYDGPPRPLDQSVHALKSPVYLFEGRRDVVAPTSCASRLFDEIAVPHKAWVWFERSAHFPFLEEPEKFQQELLRVAEANP